MQKSKKLFLILLCASFSLSHPISYENKLRFELGDRNRMQPIVTDFRKFARNVSCGSFGIGVLILVVALVRSHKHQDKKLFLDLITYLEVPTYMGYGSAVAYFCAQGYEWYNGEQIRALERELGRLSDLEAS